ncbi:DUF2062 domain-containing protein [Piscinibacter sakaiensis]|uniref:DUF2062 domain-containing protein n=1 Tax=Piscinibacter sakaiensis TaxID=1547922 RepID=A0A0K8NVC9_PISS1|nr:DUF2062 domain-containing protein [Piscinibacter sakaiensis]GAP34351.1 hypothetical protein ISF6_4526 [Piscinibacter sakaiensis]
MRRLTRWLPSREALEANRWLRWLGPTLTQPCLWHLGRRGVALGVALGIFFGLLIPVAQIPVSAAAAVALRANLPAAVASTLVTNPVTFGPIYWAAWKLGNRLLGEPAGAAPDRLAPVEPRDQPAPGAGAAPGARAAAEAAEAHALRRFWQSITGVGKPLLLGLALFAVAGGLLVYAAISLGWRVAVRLRRRRRLRRRMPARA